MLLKAKPYRNKKIISSFEKALDDISNFYGVTKFTPPKIILMENREAIDIAKGRKTKDWVIGWYDNRTVYLLCPENYSSESSHTYSNEEYNELIMHEVGHFFYEALVGSYKPIWLGEGISLYLANQYKRNTKPKKFEYFLKYYDQMGTSLYTESGHAVKLLVDKYGEEKLVKFVKSLWKHESPKEVEEKFLEIFGAPLSFETFNAL